MTGGQVTIDTHATHAADLIPPQGETAMVAQMNAQPMDVTRPNVIAWVQAYINDGMQPNEAFRQVYEDMDRLDQLIKLARLHGPNLVGSIWREANHALRPSSDGAIFRTDTQTAQLDRDMGITTARAPQASPPVPVIPIPTNRTRAYLDAMEKIGSEWVTVRNLTKRQCAALAKSYGQQADPLLRNKRYFLALEVGLDSDTQTVGEKFDDQKLARLYRMTR
jgi:hypothetical protein